MYIYIEVTSITIISSKICINIVLIRNWWRFLWIRCTVQDQFVFLQFFFESFKARRLLYAVQEGIPSTRAALCLKVNRPLSVFGLATFMFKDFLRPYIWALFVTSLFTPQLIDKWSTTRYLRYLSFYSVPSCLKDPAARLELSKFNTR